MSRGAPRFAGLALVALVVGVVLGPCVGAEPLAAADVVAALAAGPGDTVAQQLVWELRGARLALGALCGAAMAVAGSLTLSLTRNPLGTPSILGFGSGAALAILAAAVLGADAAIWPRTAAGFLGATLAGSLALGLAAAGRGSDPGVRLALAGLLVGASFEGVTAVIARWLDTSPDNLFARGELGLATWADVGALGLVVVPALVVARGLAPALTVSSLGGEPAAALGIDPTRLLVAAGSVALLLSAAVVAVCGPIGFVDLLVPFVVRRRLGPDLVRTLPATALAGAALVVWADLVGRSLLAVGEIPVGVVTAALGLPLLLVLAIRGTR